jgi:hypothetical protein
MSGDRDVPVCGECGAAVLVEPEDGGPPFCPTCFPERKIKIQRPASVVPIPAPPLRRRGGKFKRTARPHVPRFVMGPETLNRAAIPEGAPPAIVCRHCRQSVAFAFSKDPPSILIKCDRCGWQIGIGLPGVLFEARGLIVTPGGVRRIVSEGSPALGPAAVDVETMLRKGPR